MVDMVIDLVAGSAVWYIKNKQYFDNFSVSYQTLIDINTTVHHFDYYQNTDNLSLSYWTNCFNYNQNTNYRYQ